MCSSTVDDETCCLCTYLYLLLTEPHHLGRNCMLQTSIRSCRALARYCLALQDLPPLSTLVPCNILFCGSSDTLDFIIFKKQVDDTISTSIYVHSPHMNVFITLICTQAIYSSCNVEENSTTSNSSSRSSSPNNSSSPTS